MGAENPSLPSYCKAEELSGDLRANHGIQMPAERLVELASLGYLPHYEIDGDGPYFRRGEAKGWIKQNLIRDRQPRTFPDVMPLAIPEDSTFPLAPPPDELAHLCDALRELPLRTYARSTAIYFLIAESRVVYVGQTRNMIDRLAADLNRIETAFIRVLQPPLNGSHFKSFPCSEDRLLTGLSAN